MRKYLCIAIIFLALLNACKKASTISPPVSCASVSADSTRTGQFLIFNNCAKGASSSLWNFGDGSTSNQDTVRHAYYLPGIYTATLSTSNSSGKGIVDTFKILVTAPDYWTFKGVKNYIYYTNIENAYNTSSYNYLISYQAVSDSFLNISQNTGSQIAVSFAGNTPPITSHVDSVKTGYQNLITSGAAVSIIDNTGGQYTTINNNQIINITVDQSGNIIVSGDNIKVYLMPSMADSSTISFNLTNQYQIP